MSWKSVAAVLLVCAPLAGRAQGRANDQVSIDFLQTAKVMHTPGASIAAGGALGSRTNGSLLGIDSIPNWSGSFYYPGQDSYGNTQYAWQYTMVGSSPYVVDHESWRSHFENQTTVIGAPVVPVNLDLRNADGTIRFVNGHRLYVDATQFVTPTMKSPVFSNAFYDSSEAPTQYTDAVQRAEFYNVAEDDWHTLLKPRVAPARTLVLNQGTYRYSLNKDGSCCAYVLVDITAFGNAFFPATPSDTTTPIGGAENAGDVTTRDISTFLFPNTFLYFNNDPTQCCVIGYHTYDVEPGGPANGNKEKRYVLNYSSWVSPGLFGSAFSDITALSHEMSETFNDPFVNNATPWWLSANGNCQNNEEDGDVVEGLPNAEYPIALNGFTYHPQNEALLQWFAGITPSNAIHGAYSYPNTAVLPAASVSMTVNCKAPFVP